jgi:hypothetical protein
MGMFNKVLGGDALSWGGWKQPILAGLGVGGVAAGYGSYSTNQSNKTKLKRDRTDPGHVSMLYGTLGAAVGAKGMKSFNNFRMNREMDVNIHTMTGLWDNSEDRFIKANIGKTIDSSGVKNIMDDTMYVNVSKVGSRDYFEGKSYLNHTKNLSALENNKYQFGIVSSTAKMKASDFLSLNKGRGKIDKEKFMGSIIPNSYKLKSVDTITNDSELIAERMKSLN